MSGTDIGKHVSILENHPEHARAIGMISVEMANLDIYMGEMLGGLLRIHPRFGRILYLTPRSSFGRIAMIENIAETSLDKKSEGFSIASKIISKAKSLVNKRHELIHDAWGMRIGTNDLLQMQMPYLTTRDKPVEVTSLTTIVSDIRNLCDDVRRATVDMYTTAGQQQWLGITASLRGHDGPG